MYSVTGSIVKEEEDSAVIKRREVVFENFLEVLAEIREMSPKTEPETNEKPPQDS